TSIPHLLSPDTERGLDRLDQLIGTERLREYRNIRALRIVHGPAAHQEDAFGRLARANAIRQLDTVHFRHIDIGQNEVDSRVVGSVDHQSLQTVGSQEYLVAFLVQNQLQELPDTCVVVHYEKRRHTFSGFSEASADAGPKR